MSEFNDLVERYIAVWNEVDPDRRQRLIAETFSEGASYIDPLMLVRGFTNEDPSRSLQTNSDFFSEGRR